MGIVIYTDSNFLIPKGSAGCARAIFIFIRPEYKDDAGLHAHERVHVKQYIRTLGLHSLLYAVSKRYRFKAEVEAYARQLKVDGSLINLRRYAEYISLHYNLDVSADEAEEMLRDCTR